MAQRLVAYYRVSTAKQGASGLGLEGQEAAVAAYAKSNNSVLLRSYTEVETGKRSDRPELARALADCKLSRATLVIAKLDRLSRNVHFLSGLMESGVDFIACDNPHANRLTLHILAAVAEDEARRISERTRRRWRRTRPGAACWGRPAPGPAGWGARNPKAARRAGEASAARARDAYAHLAPLVARWKAEGLSRRRIAARLDAAGYATRSGKPWNHTQVGRVLKYNAS